MGKFWESLGGKLAERWATVSVPALVFWIGAALAWAPRHGGWAAFKQPSDWLGRQPGGVQAIVLASALLAVAASGLVVDRVTRRALALLEGYWPGPLRPVRRWLTARVERGVDADETAFGNLAGPVHNGSATAAQREQYVRIDQRNRRRPPTRHRLMPTYVGNVLRAAETRPIDKYGLDAVALWPHLWLLLPETARGELAAARRSLDASVAAAVWGLLFLTFTPWTWWALPAGLAVTTAAVLVWVPARAEVFADLVEASFDLYRGALYAQLRWPLPGNPAEERVSGRRVTTYLMRGLTGKTPTFTAEPAPAPYPAAVPTPSPAAGPAPTPADGPDPAGPALTPAPAAAMIPAALTPAAMIPTPAAVAPTTAAAVAPATAPAPSAGPAAAADPAAAAGPAAAAVPAGSPGDDDPAAHREGSPP